ncbi:MAG: hypothetical protein WCP01_10780 [Methylococcaceae bacterium]|jgi:hypothetical protein
MGKKILILVLALDQEPFRTIESKGQRATWAALPHNDYDVVWLHGRTKGFVRFILRAVVKILQVVSSKSSISRFRQLTGSWMASLPVNKVDDKIFTSVPETYMNTNPKTIAGLRYVLNHHDFDYLLRTNSSTYINTHLLLQYANELPTSKYYGGFLGQHCGENFASGTCTLLSRDVVNMICNDPNWEYDHIDDVAIGRSLNRAGIKPQAFSRLDILTDAQLDYLSVADLQSVFVIRCKGSESREHDLKAMHRVHDLYKENYLA